MERQAPPTNHIFKAKKTLFIPSLVYDFDGNDYFILKNITESEVIIFDQRNLPYLADGYFNFQTGELYINNSRSNPDTLTLILTVGNKYWKNKYKIQIQISDP